MKQFAIILLLVLFGHAEVFSQKTKATPKPKQAVAVDKRGSVSDDGIYTNPFFGLTMTVPSDFTIMSTGEADVYSKAGADMLKGKSVRSDKELDAAVGRTMYLLMVSTKPAGSVGNAVLEMQIVKQPVGATSNMVLAESTKLITATGKSVVVAKLKDKQIGGKKFVGVELDTSANGFLLKNRVLVSVVKGYALIIGLTFTNTSPEEMAVFDEMLGSALFRNK